MNWLRVRIAPCGSRISAWRVHCVSSEESTVAPRDSARADGIVAVGDGEGDVPVVGRVAGGGDPGDRVLEAGRCADVGLALADPGSTVAARWSP